MPQLQELLLLATDPYPTRGGKYFDGQLFYDCESDNAVGDHETSQLPTYRVMVDIYTALVDALDDADDVHYDDDTESSTSSQLNEAESEISTMCSGPYSHCHGDESGSQDLADLDSLIDGAGIHGTALISSSIR